jgi:catalase
MAWDFWSLNPESIH